MVDVAQIFVWKVAGDLVQIVVERGYFLIDLVVDLNVGPFLYLLPRFEDTLNNLENIMEEKMIK